MISTNEGGGNMAEAGLSQCCLPTKTLSYLLAALQNVADRDLEVRLSADDGRSSRPISIVAESRGHCLLYFDLRHWLQYIAPETGRPRRDRPAYLDCGISVSQLLHVLQGFEKPSDKLIEISLTGNHNERYLLNRIERKNTCCLLICCPD
ncbi:MAG: hypothetical protein LBF91_06425 [Azoarcus sp.]|nr:hypothetical protein [Azoarcus sp.]